MKFANGGEALVWAQFMAGLIGQIPAVMLRDENGQTDEAWRTEMVARIADAALEQYRKRGYTDSQGEDAPMRP